MAFFDWNGDGKKDFSDDYIEYQIYKDCTGDDDEENDSDDNYSDNSPGNNSGCGFWFWVFVVIFILGIIANWN